MRALFLALIAAITLAAGPAPAVLPHEVLDDPVLEERARDLSKGLRCLVCQNQSIDDSNASLARDLRVLVRERLTAGDTDEQVLDFVTARYGDYVLMSPPVKASTLLLWGAPGIVLLLGGALVLMFLMRGRTAPVDAAPLTAQERRRLDELTRE